MIIRVEATGGGGGEAPSIVQNVCNCVICWTMSGAEATQAQPQPATKDATDQSTATADKAADADKKPDPLTETLDKDLPVPIEGDPFNPEEAALSDEIARLHDELRRLTTCDEPILAADKAALDALEEKIGDEQKLLDKHKTEAAELKAKRDNLESELREFGDVAALESAVSDLEFTIACSSLAALWVDIEAQHEKRLTEQRAQREVVPRSESKASVDELKRSVSAASEKKLEMALHKASEESRLDAEANQFTIQLQHEENAEIDRLQRIRLKYLPLLQEQAFHLRRGSHVKHSVVEVRKCDEALDRKQVKVRLSQACALIEQRRPQVEELRREVRQFKARIKKLQAEGAASIKALEDQYTGVREVLDANMWELENAHRETQRLKEARSTLIKVTAEVKKSQRDAQRRGNSPTKSTNDGQGATATAGSQP